MFRPHSEPLINFSSSFLVKASQSRLVSDMKKVLLVLAFVFLSADATFGQNTNELWRQVEVIRTAYGVPHVRAENLSAAGYALAWLQCEDYGVTTPLEILEASGRWASVEGYQRVESDFFILRHRERALK